MRFVVVCLGALAALWGGSAFASSVYVGTCGAPNFASFSTIGFAVAHSGSPGTVFICPGTYAEQVVISDKNISLRGVTTSASSAVILTPPPGGLVPDASNNDIQVSVQGATGITISGLTIDGTNNNDSSGCGVGLYGILLQNSSGTITGNSVSNQIQPSGLNGCQNGLAIDVENADSNARSIVIRNNFVSNFQKNGITADGAGLTATISGNTVIGVGATTGAANNSIQLAFGATGTITGNYVADDVWAPDMFGDTGDAAAGILVYDSANVAITKNVVENTQYGIAVVGDGTADSSNANVQGNHIGATHLYDGIDICGSNNAAVTMNVVYGSDESGIHIDNTCGSTNTGSTVSGNTISGACAGILVGSGSEAPAATSNSIANAVNQELTGSDVCPASGSNSMSAMAMLKVKRHGRFSPVR